MATFFFIENGKDYESFRICWLEDPRDTVIPKIWYELEKEAPEKVRSFICGDKLALLNIVDEAIGRFYGRPGYDECWEVEIDIAASLDKLNAILEQLSNSKDFKPYIEDDEFLVISDYLLDFGFNNKTAQKG